MPIQLTNPLVVPASHEYAEESYDMVRLVDFRVKEVQMTASFELQYGRFEGAEWVPAWVDTHKIVVKDIPEETGAGFNDQTGQYEVGVIRAANPAFSLLVSQLLVKSADDGVPYFSALGRDILQWVADNYPNYAGTVI